MPKLLPRFVRTIPRIQWDYKSFGLIESHDHDSYYGALGIDQFGREWHGTAIYFFGDFEELVDVEKADDYLKKYKKKKHGKSSRIRSCGNTEEKARLKFRRKGYTGAQKKSWTKRYTSKR